MLVLASTDFASIISAVAAVAIALLGGGAWGMIREVRKNTRAQAVRDDRMDRVADAVLGDEKLGVPGLIETSAAQGRQLTAIQYAINPNGLNSGNIGDIAARVETSVDQLHTSIEAVDGKVARVDRRLTSYAGANTEAHNRFRAEIDELKERR